MAPTACTAPLSAPLGHLHRAGGRPGVIDLIIIKVQSGEYLGEDDIVRFTDNYGRAPAAAIS